MYYLATKMATPAASVNPAYDPKTDPARKPKRSKDPGWKYGYWADLGNRDEVTCTLCGTMVHGGIKRLKQHLAGGFGDSKICSETTTEIRVEMTNYLEKHKRQRPMYLDDEEEQVEENGEADVVVVEASAPVNEVESQASKVMPSSGTAAKKRRAAYSFKAVAVSKGKEKPKGNKTILEMLRKTPEEIVDERRKGSYQPPIQSSTKTKEQHHYVDMQWALFFYECGIPFNAAASRQFQVAVEATAQFGSGYKPPSPYQFGEPLLKDAVKLTSTMREDHERAWKHFGCTLMSDGWTDRRGRHLINFLVNSP